MRSSGWTAWIVVLGATLGAGSAFAEGEHAAPPAHEQPAAAEPDAPAQPMAPAEHGAPEGEHMTGPAERTGEEGYAVPPAEHGAPAAHGSEHAAAGGHGAEGESHDVGGFIMHHVSDSPEYEFEVPLDASKNKIIHLPRILIPLKEGGCSGEHPSLTSCLDLSISKHVMMMWIAAALLLIVAIGFSHKNKSQLVPRGVVPNMLEALVLFVRDEIAIKNIGKEEGPKYMGYLISVFFFILFMNLLGLLPWMATATGNLSVTCGLALCTFFITQFASIRAAGLKTYLSHLTGGVAVWLWPIMIPVEVLGLFTKPFALTVRLFANMVAGHIVIFFLLGLIFIMGSVGMGVVAVPMAVGIYFLELFVAFVQAYIFTLLSALFIGMGVAIAHHGHDDHHEGHGAHGAHEHGTEPTPMHH
jgi:F-type H+-transporting ATPase subunit a